MWQPYKDKHQPISQLFPWLRPLRRRLGFVRACSRHYKLRTRTGSSDSAARLPVNQVSCCPSHWSDCSINTRIRRKGSHAVLSLLVGLLDSLRVVPQDLGHFLYVTSEVSRRESTWRQRYSRTRSTSSFPNSKESSSDLVLQRGCEVWHMGRPRGRSVPFEGCCAGSVALLTSQEVGLLQYAVYVFSSEESLVGVTGKD